MSSPVTVALPPPPESSSSDVEDGDEAIEYEEIEEEFEVEEEFEDEEVEEDEIGHDLTPVRQENQGNGGLYIALIGVEEDVGQEVEKETEEDDKDDIGEDLTPVRLENHENDTSQDMELEQPEEIIQLGTATQGMPCSNPSLDNPSKQQKDGDLKTSESSESGHLTGFLAGGRTSGDSGLKAAIDDGWEMKFARKIPFTGGVNVAMTTTNGSFEKDDAGVSAELETSSSVVEVVSNVRQISPRSTFCSNLDFHTTKVPYSTNKIEGSFF